MAILDLTFQILVLLTANDTALSATDKWASKNVVLSIKEHLVHKSQMSTDLPLLRTLCSEGESLTWEYASKNVSGFRVGQ
jgi:hypothetical protein